MNCNKFSYRTLKAFRKHIIKELSIKRNYRLKIKKNHNILAFWDKETGELEQEAFAAINPIKRIVLLPIGMRKKGYAVNIYGGLAHEMVHAWQYENNLEYNEEQADDKALQLINGFFKMANVIISF